MSYELYWHGDPLIAHHYRKADELRMQRNNVDAWLQGAYFYEALCDVAPALRAFAKNSKIKPYCKEPLAVSEKQQADRAKARLEAWATSVNSSFQQREAT